MATDTFDRGDGALGVQWTDQPVSPTAALRILSNECKGDGNSEYGAALFNAEVFDDAQFSEGILAETEDLAGDQYGPKVCVRMQAGADTCYGLLLSADATREVELVERVAGVNTVLDTDTTGSAPVFGDTVRLEISETGVMSGKVNAVERVGITDTTIGSGSAGIGIKPGNNFNGFQSWAGGSLGGSAVQGGPPANSMRPPPNVRAA